MNTTQTEAVRALQSRQDAALIALPPVRTLHALVVGADSLGRIPDALAEFGIDILLHLSGRNVAHARRPAALPRNADLVLLLTDFLNHNAMRHYRDLALASDIPVIACRRSVCAIRQSLSQQAATV